MVSVALANLHSIRTGALCILSLSVLFTASCTHRPITSDEAAFLSSIFFAHTEYDKIRIVRGIDDGIDVLLDSADYDADQVPPDETLPNLLKNRTEALVVYNHIYYKNDRYKDNFMAGWPRRINFNDARLLAHEATHVWQWQNRRRTKYTPFKAILEHIQHKDPYIYLPLIPGQLFLDYRYEQQAQMVGDYVVGSIWTPDDPNIIAIGQMIRSTIPELYIMLSRLTECKDQNDSECYEK